jgi:MIP family channel proteins
LSASPNLSRKLAAEAIGTFVFVVVGAGSAIETGALLNANSASLLLVAALANGLGLAMAVSATMGISGGVLNPAVALGLWVGRKLPSREVIPYILVELVGAIAAGLALVAAFPIALGTAVQWGSPTLSGLLSVWQGITVEALLTFVLVIAVFGTAVDSRAPHIGGLGIGLAVLADVLVGGNLTGAAMNPARAYGPMIAGQFYPGYWYIYAVGPIIGAMVAGLVYRYFLESPKR